MLVVVMTKEAVPGRVKTRFAPQITLEEAAALYQCMIEDRINEVSMLEGIDLAVAYAPADARPAFSAIARQGGRLSRTGGRGIVPAEAVAPTPGARKWRWQILF